jgi:hypothetical protein
MHHFLINLLWITLLAFPFGVISSIWCHLIGFVPPKGWRFFVYDIPSFVFGIILGFYFFK